LKCNRRRTPKNSRKKIAFYVQSSNLSRKESLDKLYKTMDTIGQKAQERGLTREILESLLNEDN
jgi:hypothetical protein